MAAMTRLSLTLDPMGISHFHLFFLNRNRFEPNLAECSLDGHVEDFFIFGADRKSNMAARAHNVL
jgi:hypothetical protein